MDNDNDNEGKEKKKKQMKAVFHTACCIVVRRDISQVQDIRKRHDRAFKRWPPHLNILFPFFDIQYFKSLKLEIEKELSDIVPFKITFAGLDHFEHSKKCVLFMAPTMKDDSLEKVYNRLIKKWPKLKKHKEFRPHLTLGQFSKNQIQKKKQIFRKQLEKIEFVCKGLDLIYRENKTDPFQVIDTALFGGKVSKK